MKSRHIKTYMYSDDDDDDGDGAGREEKNAVRIAAQTTTTATSIIPFHSCYLFFKLRPTLICVYIVYKF